ncbi:hypothetical protein AB4552_24910 [Vibrio sp. 10N.222.54.C3]|uniref:hypothetical protein n=1 Tax=Vibrio sp. 10N.222.54.C3 TaxID=3229640 RepID=UPI00354E8AB3
MRIKEKFNRFYDKRVWKNRYITQRNENNFKSYMIGLFLFTIFMLININKVSQNGLVIFSICALIIPYVVAIVHLKNVINISKVKQDQSRAVKAKADSQLQSELEENWKEIEEELDSLAGSIDDIINNSDKKN